VRNMVVSSQKDFIQTVENIFKGAPSLPANIKEVLVKIAPWLALVFGILGVIAGLGAVGISPVAAIGGIRNSALVLVTGVLTIVSSIMMLLAFPKLRALKVRGWELLFWSEAVNLVASVLSLSVSSIIGALIGAAIAFYLLFQIKSYYK